MVAVRSGVRIRVNVRIRLRVMITVSVRAVWWLDKVNTSALLPC